MSSEMMVITITLLVATAAFVIFPFVQRDPDAPATASKSKAGRRRHAYETLVAEKQRVLRSIRDLDLDYDMDKLPTSVYANQRIYLIQLYVAIVRRLDDLEIEMNEQQARVEAAVAAYRNAS